MFVTAIAVFAVIPFGSVLPPNFLPASWGVRQPISLLVAPGLDVGVVYIFALGSIAVYGVVLGGWASNNKFSFLGGLRSSAQLIGYEIPLGLGILGVVATAGSLRLDAIIRQQATTGLWNAFTQPLGLMVFAVAAFAEAARLPFDLPEAEQELVGGYHTEYFGVKLLLYLVAEYVHMITAALLDRHSLPRRVAFLGAHRLGRNDYLDDGPAARGDPAGEDAGGGFLLHARPLELAAVPLRSVDDPGVVGDVAAGSDQSRGGRLLDGVRPAAGRPFSYRAAVDGGFVRRGRARCRLADRDAVDSVGGGQPAAAGADPAKLYRRGDSPAMKPDDKDIRWVAPPRLGLLGKSYLLLFVQGLTTTLRHLFRRKLTVQSPEARHVIVDPLGYRGVHRLNRDEQGRVKCVACFLCATACPAHCIDIVAAESPWPDRQKYPRVFNIDELRCIYCGMCEEACPVEAIELTSLYDLSGKSREEMIFDKEKLLSIYDQTKDREPMPSKRKS